MTIFDTNDLAAKDADVFHHEKEILYKVLYAMCAIEAHRVFVKPFVEDLYMWLVPRYKTIDNCSGVLFYAGLYILTEIMWHCNGNVVWKKVRGNYLDRVLRPLWEEIMNECFVR